MNCLNQNCKYLYIIIKCWQWNTSFPFINLQEINSQIFKDLFKAPVFDELEEVGMTPEGGLKKLSKKQLDAIWDKG